MEKFSAYVAKHLQYYVYRLLDPRTGQTFYAGKGVGNRVFAHVNDELRADADDLSDKLTAARIPGDGGSEDLRPPWIER